MCDMIGAMRVVKYFCYEQPFLKRKPTRENYMLTLPRQN